LNDWQKQLRLVKTLAKHVSISSVLHCLSVQCFQLPF
jgi:hypothetical protein